MKLAQAAKNTCTIALLVGLSGCFELLGAAWGSSPARQVFNEGQMILEGAPPIRMELASEIAPFQAIRSHAFGGWSPDSKQIYLRRRVGEVNQLHQMARPDSNPVQLTFADDPVGEVAPQPGGSLIALTRSSAGDGFDQVYLLDTVSGATQQLTDADSLNNRIAWDRAGRRLAWRSTRRDGKHNDIWMIDIAQPDAARIVLKVEDGALWKPVAFSHAGDRLLVQQYLSVMDSRVHVLDLETGALKRLAGDPDNPSGNIATDFDATDSGVHFITNQRGDAAEIGWIPLDTDAPIEFIPLGIPWDVTEFRMSSDGRRGAFVTNEGGVSRVYLFDPTRRSHAPVRRLPIGVMNGLSFSPDGRRLGLTLSTPQSPSDVLVLDLWKRPLSHRRVKQWTYSEADGLNTRPIAEPRLIGFPAPWRTREGELNIPAFLYLPKKTRSPAPVIIYIHGGPEGQFRPSFSKEVQLWVNALGAAVIAPNVRGSLGYGAGYVAMDDGRLREHAVHDIGALLDWIAKQRGLDAQRIAVVGASYGGYMALATAVHYGDRIRAAINRAGISNFVSYLESTPSYRRNLRRIEYGDERDPEMRAFLEGISPLNNVASISTPLLIVQGRNDPVVPASESLQMLEALRRQGRSVWYLEALNEGHSYERKENRDLYDLVSYQFLRHYLVQD